MKSTETLKHLSSIQHLIKTVRSLHNMFDAKIVWNWCLQIIYLAYGSAGIIDMLSTEVAIGTQYVQT